MRKLTQRAVSPVVAVILMVAVTVILSAVIGTFVFDLGQQATDGTQANIGVSTSYNNGDLESTIITGTADRVEFLVNGSTASTITNASPGDSTVFSVPSGSTVTVVSVSEGERTVVLQTTVSRPTSSTSVVAPTDGLVAYWKFDGDALDSAGNNDGTTHGGLNWTNGKDGKAGEFDAVDDYVTVPDSSEVDIASDNSYTIAFWFKTNGPNTYPTVVEKYNGTNSPNYGYIVWFRNRTGDSSKELELYHRDKNGNTDSAYTSNTYTDGKWHLAAITRNGTGAASITIYIDGNKVAKVNRTSQGASGISTLENLNIGRDDRGFYYGTALDDVRLYNQSLNASEVQDLYNATK